MREGFGIEDARIPLQRQGRVAGRAVGDRVEADHASAPSSARASCRRWPISRNCCSRFHPKPGVAYLPFIHNCESTKIRRAICAAADAGRRDVHAVPRHLRRPSAAQRQSLDRADPASWPEEIADARQRGITKGRIGVASVWGSNFLGKFSRGYRFGFLEQQTAMLNDAGDRAFRDRAARFAELVPAA